MNANALLTDVAIDALLPAPSVWAWSREDVLQAVTRARAEARSGAVFDEAAIGRVLQMAHRAASCDASERHECMEALHLTLSTFKVLKATPSVNSPGYTDRSVARTPGRSMSTVVALDIASRVDEAEVGEVRDALRALAAAYRAQAPRGARSVDLGMLAAEAFKSACDEGFTEQAFVKFATSLAEAALPADLCEIARSAHAEALTSGFSEAGFERLGRAVLARINEPVRVLEGALR